MLLRALWLTVRSPRRFVRNTLFALLCFALTVGVPVMAAGPFAEAGVTILYEYKGEAIGDAFGWVGANLGDLNGDGANEFAITAPFAGGDEAKGIFYVYDGKTGAQVNRVEGEANMRFGHSINPAGDVNKDGTLDYVVGGFGPAGRVVVYSGVDHAVLLEIANPEAKPQAFGFEVDGAGDVNGDGHADLVVGAPRADVSATITDTGRVYLLSGADGAVLWEKLGETPQGGLGSGVGGLADVNGDQVPDVAVAAPSAGENGLGEAYVLSGVDGALIHTLRPTAEAASGGTFGTFFANDAGDVNQDGVTDVFIGDYAAQRGAAANTGRAYLYSGKDGATLHVFEAEADGAGLGPGRGVADVNGDKIPDQVIAEWTSNAGVANGGKVFVFSGADFSVLHTMTGALENDSLGVDALSLGDLNGDGSTEYLLTGVGLDFAGQDVGHAYVVSVQAKAAPSMQLQPVLGGCRPIQPASS